MLEKKLQDAFCDAHFHLAFSCKKEHVLLSLETIASYSACTCAHGVDEFLTQEKMIDELKKARCDFTLLSAFGLHPQEPVLENADFLEGLLNEKRIQAIGEAGFDLYTADLKKNVERQEEVWRIQTEFAAFYRIPLIVHCRKAMDFIFRDIPILRRIPSVVFHSFSGALSQGLSILGKGVNAYFSFGKQILNGNRNAVDCISNMEMDRLLLETDAPYQTLRNEDFTSVLEIGRVYDAAIHLRKASAFELCAMVQDNFNNAFSV